MEYIDLSRTPLQVVIDDHKRVFAYCGHCGGWEYAYDRLAFDALATEPTGRLRLILLFPVFLKGFLAFAGKHRHCIQTFNERKF